MKSQYVWVIESRLVLLRFCESISPDDLIKENSSFGRGSIRNLFVHIANTYEYWIGKNCLQMDMEFTPYESITNIKEVRILFSNIDQLVAKFIKMTEAENPEWIPIERNGALRDNEPLRLFIHVITHEFHHKGQILSLSRHLGYIPVDTDIIR